MHLAALWTGPQYASGPLYTQHFSHAILHTNGLCLTGSDEVYAASSSNTLHAVLLIHQNPH